MKFAESGFLRAIFMASLTCAAFGQRGWAGPFDAAFVNPADYDSAFFVTPNGPAETTSQMVYKFLGAGDSVYQHASDPRYMGGGRYAKVGIVTEISYTMTTQGPPDYKYQIAKCPFAPTYLPPDVTSLSQLPDCVRFGPDRIQGTEDDLATWANLSTFPRAIAGLEWARYLNQPLSVQLHGGITHGGQQNSLPAPFTQNGLDWYIEAIYGGNQAGAKNQCQWDAADICDPDDNPQTFENAGGWNGANISFGTPTLADPVLAASMGYTLPYQQMARRNLRDAMTQFLTIASDPRYAGRVCAIAIDPELHHPSHEYDNLPMWANGTTSGLGRRGFYEDYHPVVIRQFQNYLQARYGDSAPNVDSNGDGATFATDFTGYVNCGWVDLTRTPPINHPHAASDLNSWSTIDPPRNIPIDGSNPSSRWPIWHVWCNFQIEITEAYVESLVATAVDAGVLPNRMYTHQSPATSSTYKNRMHSSVDFQWLSDWTHMDVSRGVSGIDQYQKYNVEGIPTPGGGVGGEHTYNNLKRRDDDWGCPEYNPYTQDGQAGGVKASQAEMNIIANSAWDNRAKVLWMHWWGGDDHPAHDCLTTRWLRDTATCNFANWTTHNMTAIGSPTPSALRADAEQIDAWVESPANLNLNAALHPYFTVDTSITALRDDPGKLGLAQTIVMDFQKTAGGAWYSVSAPARAAASSQRTYVLDMTQSPDWSGTIYCLRYHPVEHQNDHAYLGKLAACKQNPFTIAFQNLNIAKKNLARPALPPAQNIVVPYKLADNIVTLYGDGSGLNNLAVFGCDPNASGVHNDFNYVNNFFKTAGALSGTVAKDAIAVRQSTYLGLRKTGRYRQMQLPDVPALELRFFLGILDSCSVGDGVEFRIILRDHSDNSLHILFDKEWRWKRWTTEQVVDLSAYRGKLVSISFETRGIGDAPGTSPNQETGLWGTPTITVAAPAAAFLPSRVSGTAPMMVNFADLSANGPTSWAWDFENDGTTDSTVQHPQHTYGAPGTYSVKMTVTNAGGQDTVVMTNLIVVAPHQDTRAKNWIRFE